MENCCKFLQDLGHDVEVHVRQCLILMKGQLAFVSKQRGSKVKIRGTTKICRKNFKGSCFKLYGDKDLDGGLASRWTPICCLARCSAPRRSKNAGKNKTEPAQKERVADTVACVNLTKRGVRVGPTGRRRPVRVGAYGVDSDQLFNTIFSCINFYFRFFSPSNRPHAIIRKRERKADCVTSQHQNRA